MMFDDMNLTDSIGASVLANESYTFEGDTIGTSHERQRLGAETLPTSPPTKSRSARAIRRHACRTSRGLRNVFVGNPAESRSS